MIATEEQARAYVAARCEPRALANLDAFVASLRQENVRQNLVSAASFDSVWTRHIADSAQLLDLGPTEPRLWLDLGTGAGFPGLVIALMRPEWPVTLIESRKLRADWLATRLEAAGLRQARVHNARLEAIDTVSASVISARAFAPLPKLLALARRFSTKDTVWLLPKGRSAAQEVAELVPRARAMFHVEPSVTDAESGIVVGRIWG